jgi:hypothetical protein
MVALSFVHPNPAFLGNRCYTFIAKDVRLMGQQEQDDKEDIQVLRRPLMDIPGLIRDGEITHSLVIAAFYRFYMEYMPACHRRRHRAYLAYASAKLRRPFSSCLYRQNNSTFIAG